MTVTRGSIFDANGNLKVPLHVILGGAGHDLIFDAGRAQTSSIVWNANATNQFGMIILIDGVTAFTLQNDGSIVSPNGISLQTPKYLTLNSDNQIKAITYSNTGAWQDILAKSFAPQSDAALKYDIQPYVPFTLPDGTVPTGEELVNKTTVYMYHFNEEAPTELLHVGLKLQECPADIVNPGGGVDLYSMTSVLWKAVQELSAKVANQTTAINNQAAVISAQQNDIAAIKLKLGMP
jgi:hypothetical protein